MLAVAPDGSGFHITFANGWTASVMWGRPVNMADLAPPIEGQTNSRGLNAEIAAWDANGKWYRFPEGDVVLGRAEPEKVAEFLVMVSKLP